MEALLERVSELLAASLLKMTTITTIITITKEESMKAKSICLMAVLALLLVPMTARDAFAQNTASPASTHRGLLW